MAQEQGKITFSRPGSKESENGRLREILHIGVLCKMSPFCRLDLPGFRGEGSVLLHGSVRPLGLGQQALRASDQPAGGRG